MKVFWRKEGEGGWASGRKRGEEGRREEGKERRRKGGRDEGRREGGRGGERVVRKMKRTPKHKTFLTHLLLSLCKKKWLVVGHRVVGGQGEGIAYRPQYDRKKMPP